MAAGVTPPFMTIQRKTPQFLTGEMIHTQDCRFMRASVAHPLTCGRAITRPAVGDATGRGTGAPCPSRGEFVFVNSTRRTPSARGGGRPLTTRSHDRGFAPDRSNEPFDVGVLPRRTRRRQNFLNANRLHVIDCMISIAKEITRQLVPRERDT